METSNFNGICRCCASEGAFKDIKRTYQWMGEEEVYGEMIKECFDIDLTTREDIAGGICEVCITQLRNASNFKKQVLHTEEQFKKHPQMKFFKSTLVKVEQHEDRLDSDDNIDNNSIEDGFSGNEFDVPIKSESLEEQKPKKRTAKASTSKAKKSKVSEESSDKSTTKRANQKTNIVINEETEAGGVKKRPRNRKSEIALHRNNIREILLWSNATPIRKYGGIGYTCAYCEKQYREPADLKKHTVDDHNDVSRAKFMLNDQLSYYLIKLDITDLICKFCNTKIKNLDDLTEHLKSVHDRKIFNNIKSRILPFRFDSDTMRCVICEHPFNTFKKLMEHTSTHFRNFICDTCNAGFVNHSALKGHSLSHRTGAFVCYYCPKVLSNLRQKVNHEKTHKCVDNKRYKCGYCNEAFRTARSKEMHVNQAHGVPQSTYKCQACDKTFAIRKVLRVHIKRDHLMERPHKCTVCDKSFFRSEQLKEHMVRHTGLREFECGVCRKKFGAKGTLKHHIRKHGNCDSIINT